MTTRMISAFMGVALAVTGAKAELHEFKTPDGKSVKAEILDYNAKLGQVELEREDGKRVKVKAKVFVAADQSYIREWASMDGFRNATMFRIECDDKKVDQWKEGDDAEEMKFEKYIYEVTLKNRGPAVVTPLKAEYRVFYEQEENDSATKKVVTQKRVVDGVLDITRVEAGEETMRVTNPIILKEYEFNSSDYYDPDGDPESTSGEIQGIWLKLTVETKSGQKVVRDVYEPESIKGKYVW